MIKTGSSSFSNIKFGAQAVLKVYQGANLIWSPSSSGGSTYDANAQAFITAAAISNDTQKGAVNQLVLDLKSAGIWSKLKAVYPMVGGTATSHAVNLKSPGIYNITFNGGCVHSSTGVQFDGTSGYGDSNFNTYNNLTINSGCFGFYSLTESNPSSNATDIGNFSSNVHYLRIKTYGATTYKFGQNENTYLTASSLGFFMVSRQDAANSKLYFNGNSVANNTATNTESWSNCNIGIGAGLYPGGSTNYSDKQCAFAVIGDGLSDTEVSAFYTIVQNYQSTLGRAITYGPSYDADAQAFITAAGLTDNTQKTVVNQLVVDLKNNALWGKIKALYPMIGGNATAHAVNLKSPGTFDLTFVGSPTHTATGVKFDGVSQYADTGLNPYSALSYNSGHLSYYSRTEDDGGGYKIEIGAEDNNYFAISVHTFNGYFYGITPSYSPTFTNNDTTLGFYIVTADNSNQNFAYKNGSNIYSGPITPNDWPMQTIFIGAGNALYGGAIGYSDRECALASIGDSLSNSEAAAYNTVVQTYETSLGRQV